MKTLQRPLFILLVKSGLFFYFFFIGQLYAQLALDHTFGSGLNGKLSISSHTYTEVLDLKLGTTDSIFVLSITSFWDSLSGFYDSDILITKYDADGLLDLSFGSNGKLLFDFTGTDVSIPSSFDISNHKITILGHGNHHDSLPQQSMYVAVLSKNGKIDSSFGNMGSKKIPFYENRDISKCLFKDSKNRYLIGGSSKDSNNITQAVIGRLDTNYNWDPSFGYEGKIKCEFVGGFDSISKHLNDGDIRSIIEIDDGYLVGGGDDTESLIGKVSLNGQADLAFNSTGFITYPSISTYSSRIEDIAKIGNTIIFGKAEHVSGGPVSRDFQLFRLNYNTLSSVSELIDYKNTEDIIKKLVEYNGSLFAVGWSLDYQNAWISSHRSDYMNITQIPDINNLDEHETIGFQFYAGLQCGLNCVAVQSTGRVIAAGFSNVPASSERIGAMIALKNKPSAVLDQTEVPINIFPNPNNGSFYISFPGTSSFLKIYDSLGHLVYESPYESEITTSLIPGHYNLIVISKNGDHYSKPFLVAN
ncbi:MAG: T9SS type A sorting domain-containing protein [Flavobacteriales bacterium]|nr:T9SS type A sorting domain-containing protein [Flavobacteriales bacterium]